MPELDALRGVACLLVLFFHGLGNRYVIQNVNLPERLLVRLSSFGWTGVNLFFVLSGFLITGILLDTRDRTDFYRRFYIRRALRILPAYYGILILVAVAWRVGVSDRPNSWSFLALSTIYLANMTPLFGVPIEFGVLWSLAVEEHFYLFWPVCVRRLTRRHIFFLAVGICIVALALRIVAFQFGYNPRGWYTWLVCDGLAMGALLAIGIRHYCENRNAVWRITGLAFFIAFGSILIDELGGQRIEGGALQITGINAFFASLLVTALMMGSRFGIRFRVLEFFGDISYGVYLVHTLFFDIYDTTARKYFPGLAPEHLNFPRASLRFLLVAAVTVAAATLSRWQFEERFLRLKDRLATPGSPDPRASSATQTASGMNAA